MAFAVKVAAVATPLAFVDAVMTVPPLVPPVNVPLAPLDGEVNVTVTPLSRFPPPSFTVAVRLRKRGAEHCTLRRAVGSRHRSRRTRRLVREKFAGPTAPAFAVTIYGPPAVPFAVNVGAVATPLVLVVAVTTVPPLVPPVNVPLAPLAGEVNVTTTPSSGWELASFTVTESAVEKATLMATLCGVVRALAVMESACPAYSSG